MTFNQYTLFHVNVNKKSFILLDQGMVQTLPRLIHFWPTQYGYLHTNKASQPLLCSPTANSSPPRERQHWGKQKLMAKNQEFVVLPKSDPSDGAALHREDLAKPLSFDSNSCCKLSHFPPKFSVLGIQASICDYCSSCNNSFWKAVLEILFCWRVLFKCFHHFGCRSE